MNIIYPLEGENSQDYISRILSSRENKEDEENYQEVHHITPKSCNGSNDCDNLIYLYAQEHYFIHKMLAQENPQNHKLNTAWWMMCHCHNPLAKEEEIIISAEEYAEARERFVKNITGEENPYYGVSGINAAWYGKTHTEESRQKISLARKEYSKKHSKSKKEITHVFTESHRKNLSKNHCDVSGGNNPRAKKVLCIETGVVFNTAKEAGEYYNLTPANPGSTIRFVCKEYEKGNIHTTGYDTTINKPLHWKFV